VRFEKEANSLRRAIRHSLRTQGFEIQRGRVSFRRKRDKRSVRKRHEFAVAKRILRARNSLVAAERELLGYIANGTEVDPQRIRPKLCRVEADTVESQLFRYACLHWSIPISEGYGRRMRYLIFDEANGKLMGLFGLGDPVYAIRARDQWVGWDAEQKRAHLYHVMDAYVLGGVPPYSSLLSGKLVALACACDEVRRVFRKRYSNLKSLILGKKRDAHLVLITTTSALGRSSLYNRVKFGNRLVFESVGYTGGWGEFHFSDGVYERISAFALKNCRPTAKQQNWGKGFRNRRELVRKVLSKIGFSQDMLNHGVQREIFVVCLAKNSRSFLRGQSKSPRYFRAPFSTIADYWRTRWLLPRAQRDITYLAFRKSEWALW
jgi:hypothetical protein